MSEKLNILLVEDNPADAELLKQEFKMAGRNIILKRVETKNEYENELELQGTLIDIVVSDYKLPQFDCITALRILKEKNIKIPFIVVTGSINEETAIECIKAGAQDYVIKGHLMRIVPAVDSAIKSFRVSLEKEYAEDKLSKSEERTKLMFENAGLPIVSLDSSGVVLMLNDVAAKYIGGKREDILGKSVYDIFPRPYAEKFHSAIKNVIENLKGYETEGKIVVCGEERWISTNIQPAILKGSTVANAQLIVHDITELKETEEALRLNYRVQTVINELLHLSLEDISLEEIFDKVLEQILTMPFIGAEPKGAIFTIDRVSAFFILKALRGFPEEMRPACAQIPIQSGFCREILNSGKMEFIEKFFDCCPGRHCNLPGYIYFCIPIKSAEDTLGILVLCIRKDGGRDAKKFETLSTVAEVIAGIIRRKHAEKDKKEYESHLMQSSKLAALGQMAAGVAHELNNPLTIIMGNTQYLMEHGAVNDDSAKVLSEINEAAQRCRNIIMSLLEFSREKELKFQKCSLNDLIDHVLHLTENETKLSKVKIVKEYNPELPLMNVSYTHIEQVFLNIVINAVQAMENGGDLTINTDFSKDNNGVDISFADQGAGIPAENISKVFNPFFTTKPKGTGLGLAISYGIMKQHGGDIKVKSPGAGKGTVFTIKFPLIIGQG